MLYVAQLVFPSAPGSFNLLTTGSTERPSTTNLTSNGAGKKRQPNKDKQAGRRAAEWSDELFQPLSITCLDRINRRDAMET
jgi:hypothetical protein